MSDAARPARSTLRVLLPTVATLAALLVLLSLGWWQLDRKVWKEGLIRQIETRAHEPAGAVVPEAEWPGWRADADEFRRVKLAGRFQADKTVAVHGLAELRRAQATQGFYLFTPLRLDDGSTVVINRGFVPTELLAAASAPPPGRATVVGLVRAPESRSAFMPANDATRDSWWVRDISDMARAKSLDRVAPFYVDADGAPLPGEWPKGGQTPLTLRNPHLGYALTWFGLAATLVGVAGTVLLRQIAGRGRVSAAERTA